MKLLGPSSFPQALAVIGLGTCFFILSSPNTTGAEITISEPAEFLSEYVAEENYPLDINVIGIYESKSFGEPGGRQGTARVRVPFREDRRPVPLVLVLSAYEPTLWEMDIDEGVNISEIVLNGYNRHEIANAGDIKVTNLSGESDYIVGCAFMWPDSAPTEGCHTRRLVREIEKRFEQPISSFSGTYRTKDITIIGTRVPGPIKMKSITRTRENLVLTVTPPKVGEFVGIEYSETSEPGTWIELGNATPIEGRWTFIDPDLRRLARPTGFYRAFVRPPLE